MRTSTGWQYRQAAALLGYTPDSLLDEFVDAFAAGDAGGVFACVDKVIEVGQDPRRFAEDLLRRLRDLVIVAAVPDALTSGLVDVAADQAERLGSQAAALGAGELTRAAEVIAVGLTDMRGTTAPRLHLELMCARALLPGADVDDRGIHARLDRLERRMGMVGALRSAPPDVAPSPSPSGRPDRRAGRRCRLAAPRPVEEPRSRRPGVEPGPTHRLHRSPPSRLLDADARRARRPYQATRPGGTPEPTSRAAGRVALTVTDVRRLWPEVLKEVKGRRRFTWILLSQNAHVVEVRDGVLMLAMAGIGPRDSFAKGGSQDVLHEALIDVLGVDLRIETMVDPGGGSSSRSQPREPPDAGATPPAAMPAPAAARSRHRRSRPRRASRPGSWSGPPGRRPARIRPRSTSATRPSDRDDVDLDQSGESHHRAAGSPARRRDHRRGRTRHIGWLRRLTIGSPPTHQTGATQ